LKSESNPSLWWQLSWQLGVVFIIVIATVIIGLCVYGAMILSPTVGLEQKLSAAVNEALKSDRAGALFLDEGPALRNMKSQYGKLWFVVAASDGATISFGEVPSAYRALSQFVHLFKDADIRGGFNIDEIASIDSMETSVGEVRVMYGGKTNKAETFWVMLTKTYPIYVPLLAIMLPATFFAVPRIVARALRGLNAVVKKAPTIDPHFAGARLPVEAVPREVIPLIVAFNDVLERLEKQLQARKSFLIDAAHELRTPIAIMQTRIESMSAGQERRRLMADVARLGETAEQLLEFERSDHGTDRYEQIDLVELTRGVVADIAPLAIAAGYEISFESDTPAIDRLASSSSLYRAISNLIRNAIDHGGNGGLISVVVSANGSVAVSDEGPGISQDLHEQVFEPFYRVTPRSKGAGLGLSLVRQIVSSHGGEVTVHSVSRGATFTIWL
jgi:signal transduction histidine kinase